VYILTCKKIGALPVMCMEAVMALAAMQSASSTVNEELKTTKYTPQRI
jgi:hypothetical protein